MSDHLSPSKSSPELMGQADRQSNSFALTIPFTPTF